MIKIGQERILLQGNIRIEESPTEVTDLSPVDNTIHIQVKDKAGVATPYWKDDADVVHEFAGTAIVPPIDADYLVKTANATLTAERVVTDNTSITADWSVAGQVKFQREALTGDVTASQNSNATTIANNAVTNAKAADMAAWTYKIRNASSLGDPSDAALADFTTATPSAGDYAVGFTAAGAIRKFDVGTFPSTGSSNGASGHVHSLTRLVADGVATTFNLLDILEYIDTVHDGGSLQDELVYTLSSDGSQITFDSAPTVGHPIHVSGVMMSL